jgi:uncharacterized protein (UPF0335 family)
MPLSPRALGHEAVVATEAGKGAHRACNMTSPCLSSSLCDRAEGRTIASTINDSVTFLALPYWSLLRKGAGMTDTTGIPGERIRSFIERVEHIDEEIKALNEGKKEVLAEAKGEGFDVKVLKEIVRLRKLDKDERDEHESLLDLYLRAIESVGSEGGVARIKAKGGIVGVAAVPIAFRGTSQQPAA